MTGIREWRLRIAERLLRSAIRLVPPGSERHRLSCLVTDYVQSTKDQVHWRKMGLRWCPVCGTWNYARQSPCRQPWCFSWRETERDRHSRRAEHAERERAQWIRMARK